MPLINVKARVQFDFGARKLLAEELARLNACRPLIVSDKGIAKSGVLEMALAAIRGTFEYVLFDEVAANPTLDGVESALTLFRGQHCDSVVAIGGGSPIDTAKCVALLARNSGTFAEYSETPEAARRITHRAAPLIAIPTTAGTGSEIGRGIGIGLVHGQPKAVLRHDYLIPDTAICDPELTLTMPAWLTAGTGIDAFSHCLEGYLSKAVNPPVDAIAIDGMVRIANFLPRAIEDGGNREARWQVLMGAVEGGMCMVKGLGPAHALSIPIDTLDLHHGTVVGIVLPEAVRFMLPEVESKLHVLAFALKLSGADQVPDFIADLNRRIALPASLSELGVPASRVQDFAMSAAGTSFNQTSPRQATTADFAAMLKSCL